MRPAFSSTSQAAAFVLLLLLFLAAPLTGKMLLPPRKQSYAAAGCNWGPYPWISRQIFDETNDIDIAFIGSSHMMLGIDTGYVQQQLDARLGRKTAVRSICWGGGGFDSLYFITRDLLARRHVKMVVFYDETASRRFNPVTPCWFRYGEDRDELAGLSFKDKCSHYFAAMVGMPRNVLEFLTPGLEADPHFYPEFFNRADPSERLGSMSERVNYGPVNCQDSDFITFHPATGVTPADVVRYSPKTAGAFAFSNEPLPDWQIYFARKFSRQVQSHGGRLVLVHLPVLAENQSPVMTEARYWPDFLQAEVPMIGIPGARLFAGLAEPQIKQLYEDSAHLNQNGQNYFTPLITPDLLQLYENQPVQ